ncbi:uncharacterized protein PITG_12592 [Phytophthora infestans T30-4]|uniref:Carbohydrate-binding protein n=1 Tax=Phytophthora infestans (strain T30-4) TaxID=403677 RepID=D0NNC9_PHYIT|nr:uncharacterized protein PITG_12592 [Phytophthora infestans T30-4]EEY62065.1 conserved hypothetical protein [Phytophthora infestans T30-4]|eukprot:XP_002899369.1 conserved hypothetical protein [Phytophthora infestans T30-4]
MPARRQVQQQVPVLAILSLLASAAFASDTSDFCSSVTSCLKDGSTTCDTTTGDCPPCIYALDGTYTCWEKDNSTNTCPFTGVRYDCSDSWGSKPSSSTNSAMSSSTDPTDPIAGSSTASTSSSSEASTDTSSSTGLGGLSSSLITRKMRRRREENVAATARRRLSLGPYNNILDTSKVNYASSNMNAGYSGRRKGSRPDPMDTQSHVPTDESPRSFDGMLADASQSPAVLGGNTRGSRKSGGRNVQASPVVGGIGGFSNVSEYVQQDISSRCTATPNVFGEYLRMKQEMQYDEADRSTMGGMSGVSFSDTISDLDSGKYSFQSSQGIGRPPQRRTDLDGRSSMADSLTDSIADSVTDSEYAEQLRARGESDCYSEMSYNDEKYSFSSLDGLDDSQVREGKREVEI